ncbi:MAG: ATP-binding protein [Candidatus Cyclobacteriaceae bacterium M2_1C_046]
MKRIILLLFFAFPFLGWAQKQLNQPDVYFEHLFLPGALHFNPINDIKQDSTGLMWFASNNGIYRFDGYNILNLNDYINLQAVKERAVSSILAGPDNFIYASLKEKRGIVKMKNDYSDLKYIKDSLSAYEIDQLFFFQNKVGFLSKGKGLFFLDEQDQKAVPFSNGDPPYSIIQEKNTLYVGSKGRVVIYSDSATSKVIKIPETDDNIISLVKNQDQLWIATQLHVYRYNLKSQRVDKTYTPDLINDNINFIYFHEGNLWVLTERSGIYLLNNKNEILQFEKNYYKKGSLSSNRAKVLFKCNGGIIWIGTGAGINKYDHHKRYFSHISHDPSNIKSLSSDLIRAVYEGKDEELLIGSDDGVINIIDSARKTIERVPIKLKVADRIVPFSFTEDPFATGNILIGTSHGLVRFNKINRSFQLLSTPEISFDHRIRQVLLYDSIQLLYLTRGYVNIYNIINGKSSVLGPHPDDKLNTLKGGARTLLKDNDDIFIGGMGELVKYNPKTNEFYSRRIVSASDEGDTTNHMILSLIRYENKLYIGTFQGGLYILDITDPELKGSMTRYTKNNGLPDNTIYSSLRDSRGFFWISTNHGISRYNPENENFYNYDRDNGLQGEEFNRLAYAQTKRGEFVFGGIEGLNIFFPDKMFTTTNFHSKPVLLYVDIINQFSEEGALKNPTFSLLNKDQLLLNYDQNYLSFKFTSNNFSQPEKNKYYYKLENYDQEWIYNSDHSATYTGLKPGKYVFQVKSVAPDGSISKEYASIPVVITARWWKSWWVGLLLGAIIFSLISVSYRRSMKKNKAIKSFLEKEIERRTRELKESKEELARLNKKKDFIFSILSHDLRSPLTTLKGFLGILVDHFDTLDEKDIKLHAVNIKNSVAKSLDLLDNTLFWSLSQMGEISYQPHKVSLDTLFEKITGLYDLTALKKNIKIISEVEENIFIYADENMTSITIRNLVSNALKFTPPGKNIYLKVYKNATHAVIKVKDEGQGIKAEDLTKLFDRNQNFMQKGTNNEKGTGLGLILCKQFTEMNNGLISVESTENIGSVFVLKLPLYQEHSVAVSPS